MAPDALHAPTRPLPFTRPRGALAALAAFAALAGCNDPVPPPAQGAVSFDMGGQSCPITSTLQDLQLGAVTDRNNSPLVDGETGTVNCRVVPKGGAFDVSLQLGSDDRQDTFTLSGTVVPGQATEVLLSVRTRKTLTDYQSAPPGGCGDVGCGLPCRVSFPTSPDPQSPTFSVGAGRIWAAFECPALVDTKDLSNTTCPIPLTAGTLGFLVFENCDEG